MIKGQVDRRELSEDGGYFCFCLEQQLSTEYEISNYCCGLDRDSFHTSLLMFNVNIDIKNSETQYRSEFYHKCYSSALLLLERFLRSTKLVFNRIALEIHSTE